MPELFMVPYIVGFDTIAYYVPTTLKWVNYGADFWEFFGTSPLFYLILSGLTLAGVPLVVSLKVLPPILHGLLGFAIYQYATKGLAWSPGKGLFASLLATLYFVGLRISWDMLRSQLGLIFLFVFLIMLQGCLSNFSWKRVSVLAFSALLVVLSHQLVSVLMFAIVFAVVLEMLIKRDYSSAKWAFAACLPALTLFLLVVYADYVVLPAYADEIVEVGRIEWLNLMGYSSIPQGIAYTIGFFVFCYFPLLPFVAMRVREFRGLELKAWSFWCLIGAFTPFLLPLTPLSYRWILLLAFPLAFFAIEGFGKINSRLLKGVSASFMVLLSFSFVFLPAEAAFPYFSLFPSYVPSSMLQNSVPLSDCRDVVEALKWVENSFDGGDFLLVHDAFHGWALLYADGVEIVHYGYASPENAALAFSQNGYRRVYLVWWVSGEGWHGWASLPSTFKEVYRSGRIAIYKFEAFA
ncbi:MAG: hypothetical protein QXX79_02745 [Candidatus Bathyarchaeia archaeon]